MPFRIMPKKAASPRRSKPVNANGFRTQGLSLIELLITLCIISIVAGVSAVSYQTLWTKEQVESATHDLIQQLQLTRIRSILENRSYRLSIEDQQLIIEYLQNDQWVLTSAFHLNTAIYYQVTGNISFSAKGFASPKTLMLHYDGVSKKVVININGRIRTE